MTFRYSTDLANKPDADFPDGNYQFSISSAEEKLTKALPVRNMLVLTLQVFNPTKPGQYLLISDYLVEDSKYLEKKMHNIAISVGRPELFKGQNECYEFGGLSGECSIKFDNNEKFSGYRVDKYLPKEEVSVTELEDGEEIPF